MRDWTLIARALAPDIPAEAVERVATPLDALESAFRPLTLTLAPDTEPATVFGFAEESR